MSLIPQTHEFAAKQLQKIKLISYNTGYGLCPDPHDEVEQHLTIDCIGNAMLLSFCYGDENTATCCYSTISTSCSHSVFQLFETYFTDEFKPTLATDVGFWELELTTTDGETHQFQGSFCHQLIVEDVDLSDLLRACLGLPQLFAFDGQRHLDPINKIVVEYLRTRKFKRYDPIENVYSKEATWSYRETLTIDRMTQTIEHIQTLGTGCVITKKYEAEDGVAELLDFFNADDLFCHVIGNREDAIETPDDLKDYRITVDYETKPQKILTGSFDRYGLPDDFGYFVEHVLSFMQYYGQGDIFNSFLYNKAKQLKSDYIFCSVAFNDSYKTYYYLTDDDGIEIGDFVVVPAGRDNHETIAEVKKIEYFSEENAPFPVTKTKWMIRKESKRQL
ncbi:MAG: hypothetical protein SNH27_10805 [Rikenellaceae bacterium]